MYSKTILAIATALLVSTACAKDFSGARALEFTQKAVSFGPRPPDSAAEKQLRTYIVSQLKSRGAEVTEDSFNAQTPHGPVAMKNIIARFPGKSGRIVAITGHYDTKDCGAPYDGCQGRNSKTNNFVGANDGGSSTGFLLEMAEALPGTTHKDDIDLIFFDGEEAYGEWSDTNSLYGSRHLADKWAADGTLAKVKALINVDMIGDKDLGLVYNSGSASSLEKLVWDAAGRLGYSKYFLRDGSVTGDDHVPFINKGVRALDLIDFDYGPDTSSPGQYWHTPEDTMDKLSAQSLQIVGSVIQKAIQDLEDWK